MEKFKVTTNIKELFIPLYSVFEEMLKEMEIIQGKMDNSIFNLFPKLRKISNVYINRDNLQVYGDWEKEGVEPDILGRILDSTTYEGRSISFSDMSEEQISLLREYYALSMERREYNNVLENFNRYFNSN